MRGPTRVKRKESEKHPLLKLPKKAKIPPDPPKKQQKWIFCEKANVYTYHTIENYLKIRNYEILTREFEVNLKNCIFLLKLPKKAKISPLIPPKNSKNEFFMKKWKRVFLDSRD